MERIIQMNKFYKCVDGKIYFTRCYATRTPTPIDLKSQSQILSHDVEYADVSGEKLCIYHVTNAWQSIIYAVPYKTPKIIQRKPDELMVVYVDINNRQMLALDSEIINGVVNKEKFQNTTQKYYFEQSYESWYTEQTYVDLYGIR